MQEVLSSLVSYPSVEFDQTYGVVGNNEEYFRYGNDCYLGQHEGYENKIVCDSDDNSTTKELLVRCLMGYSCDTDSNELSRRLVEEYRNELLKTFEASQ